MTSFILKIIAMSTMFCDHFGYALFHHFSFFNYIGRIAFSIFAFQISQGFKYTKNLKNYCIRLLSFALISQIPFSLYIHKFLPNSSSGLNIFFTLLLGLLAIIIYNYFETQDSKEFNYKILGISYKYTLGIMFVLFVAYLGELIHVDYGFLGIIVIFSFYLFRNNKLATAISYILICSCKYGFNILMYGFHIEYIYLMLATMLPIIFILLYNGKQGHKIKYLLYLFYPLHLLALYLIF